MRLVFYLCPNWPIWDTRNWPTDVPKEGCQITFSTVNGDEITGEVVHVEEAKEKPRKGWEEYVKVCMDMGKSAQDLRNKVVEIGGWRKKYHPPPK